MSSNGFSLSCLLEKEHLREDGHGFKEDGEGPQELKRKLDKGKSSWPSNTSRIYNRVDARGPLSSKKNAPTMAGKINASILKVSSLALYVARKRNQE
jgi:hypothetical protein